MSSNDILNGKKVLIVDDEKDILESLIELLDMCKIDTATSFEEGKKLLETQIYDIAILDIMGVKGFELLQLANKHRVPALMLTANSLNKESLKRAAEEGAVYFAPKEKMVDIETYIADILKALEKNKSPWERLFQRLGGFYDKRFHGTKWREDEKEFWEKKAKSKYLL